MADNSNESRMSVPEIVLPTNSENQTRTPESEQMVKLLKDKKKRKVPLRPGFSLGDWLKLNKSGKDLAGTGGQMLEVTMEEVARHNTEQDAWMVLGIHVYNVTEYLDFHPGGKPEIMRAVGGNGSPLFNSIHPWVNYQYFLKNCLVGRLIPS